MVPLSVYRQRNHLSVGRSGLHGKIFPGACPVGKFNHVAIGVMDEERMVLRGELYPPGWCKASSDQAVFNALKLALRDEESQVDVRASLRAMDANARAASLGRPQAKVGAGRCFHPERGAF